MSEYIYDMGDANDPLHEKVVRCRDCRHSRHDGIGCAHFAAYEPIPGGDEFGEILADVEPDGFCAWAERRDA